MPQLRSLIEYSVLGFVLYYFLASSHLTPLLQQWGFQQAPDSSSASRPRKAGFETAFQQDASHSHNDAIEGLDNLVMPRDDAEIYKSCAQSPISSAARGPVLILSHEPLVLYVPDFISPSEIDYIISTGSPLLTKSTTTPDGGRTEVVDTKVRNSTRAQLPSTGPVQCIEHRARQIQGFRKNVYVEKLWLQRYEAGGHYGYHFDWSGDIRSSGRGRISSFMVFLNGGESSMEDTNHEDLLEGGGTHFPYLEMPSDPSWCQYLECDDSKKAEGKKQGITFLPKRGNAVYWENFHPVDGTGYEETLHAGLPVTRGVKYGLNIWSWYQPGYKPRHRE